MPQFCRHNRFTHLCPICSRESVAPRASRRPAPARPGGSGGGRRSAARPEGLRVRRLRRAPDDGFASPLVAGLRSSEDAGRLAEEIAFAAGRLALLGSDPPGLWLEVALEPDPEEALWLAFLIALLGPLEDDDPWSAIRLVHRPWGELAFAAPDAEPALGPRSTLDLAKAEATVAAYRGWAARAGSQAATLNGEAAWSPERRFARAFERLALPGVGRGARFDFLATVAALGRAELAAGALGLGVAGSDDTVAGAKRAFGIGDAMLLERRALALAEAAAVDLAALDLALASWERGERIHGGVGDDAADAEGADRARAALGL